MGVRHYLRVHLAYLSLHMKTAMEYRTNFIVQSIFMMFNDAIFALVFLILFSQFKSINGYTVEYAMIVFGITAMGYGFVSVFYGNRRQIWEMILEGKLDVFLCTPIDELYHALITRSAYDGLGDILFGVIMVLIFAPNAIFIGIIGAMLGAIVLLSFVIMIDSTGFFLDHPKAAVWSINNFVLSFSSWPIDAYTPAVRAFAYTIPFAFIGTVPYHLVAGFSWQILAGLVAVAFVMMTLAILIWKLGLRRYESGNMMTVRT